MGNQRTLPPKTREMPKFVPHQETRKVEKLTVQQRQACFADAIKCLNANQHLVRRGDAEGFICSMRNKPDHKNVCGMLPEVLSDHGSHAGKWGREALDHSLDCLNAHNVERTKDMEVNHVDESLRRLFGFEEAGDVSRLCEVGDIEEFIFVLEALRANEDDMITTEYLEWALEENCAEHQPTLTATYATSSSGSSIYVDD